MVTAIPDRGDADSCSRKQEVARSNDFASSFGEQQQQGVAMMKVMTTKQTIVLPVVKVVTATQWQ